MEVTGQFMPGRAGILWKLGLPGGVGPEVWLVVGDEALEEGMGALTNVLARLQH